MRLEDTVFRRRVNPEGRGVHDVILLDPQSDGHLIVRSGGVQEAGIAHSHSPALPAQVRGVVAGLCRATSGIVGVSRKLLEDAQTRLNAVFGDLTNDELPFQALLCPCWIRIEQRGRVF